MKCKKNYSKAFTLIELLVVISIIALLLSILMPSLTKAKEMVQYLVCRSNIKQLGLATALWSEDNEGWAPPALWDRGNTGSGEKFLLAYLDTETGDRVMSCPTVKKYAGKTFDELDLTDEVRGLANGGNYYNSYGYNHYLCGDTSACPGVFDVANDGGGQWGKDAVWYKTHGNCKLITVRKPVTTVLFAESILYLSAPWFYTKVIANPAFNDPSEKGRRHSPKKRRVGNSGNHTELCGDMNISWVDGSVSVQPDDIDVPSGNGFSINSKYWSGN